MVPQASVEFLVEVTDLLRAVPQRGSELGERSALRVSDLSVGPSQRLAKAKKPSSMCGLRKHLRELGGADR
jgi:hypothetical protein